VPSPTGTQAVDRAALLLREVVHGQDPVTFTELTAATGLAKSTTSRLLMALERAGLVRRDARGHFRPGEMFIRYAWRGGAEAGLTAVAQPFWRSWARPPARPSTSAWPAAAGSEQVAQVDSTYLIGGTNWVGLSVPLHCAALGKVLLAWGAAELPPSSTERAAPKTITSRATLAADLVKVRTKGYAVTDEELEPGLIAVAAPVFRAGGVLVAALSVSGPSSRLHGDRITHAARHAMAQAAALSAALGHEPPPEQREGAQ
jgi:DNA-binding IclR family transcriptional regulator